MIIVIIAEILHCMGSYVKLMSILNNALENQKEAAGGQVPPFEVFNSPRETGGFFWTYSRSTKANTVCLLGCTVGLAAWVWVVLKRLSC